MSDFDPAWYAQKPERAEPRIRDLMAEVWRLRDELEVNRRTRDQANKRLREERDEARAAEAEVAHLKSNNRYQAGYAAGERAERVRTLGPYRSVSIEARKEGKP